jgi:Mg-chelatase subunit ChlD
MFRFGWVLALAAAVAKSAPAAGAGLALVLAVDVSGSVSADSYLLQRNGIACAFEDPRLVSAISAVAGGIEALVLEWSDPDRTAVTVGWTLLADGDSASAFAAAIRATRRSSEGLTAIGPALLTAAAAFERAPRPAARQVIDISGDGMANFGLPPSAARDRVIAAGISINGLAILTEEPWLEAYYRSNVIGGSGAFVVAARDLRSFADAMLRKLVREVANAGSSGQMQ